MAEKDKPAPQPKKPLTPAPPKQPTRLPVKDEVVIESHVEPGKPWPR
jgi:hypothetical protein